MTGDEMDRLALCHVHRGHQDNMEMEETKSNLSLMLLRQLEDFTRADRKAAEGDYDTARTIIRASEIDPDIKARLEGALETGVVYAIRRVFEEYELRLGQALCEECWDAGKG